MGLNEEIVKNVINMVEKSEWKRRQYYKKVQILVIFCYVMLNKLKVGETKL